MSLLARVLGQTTDTVADVAADAADGIGTIVMPAIQWRALAPINVMIGGALVLLVLASLARHTKWIGHVYVWATCAIAGAAGIFALDYGSTARDVTKPASAVSDALRIDGFATFVTVLICVSVILATLIADGFLKREGLHGPEVFVLTLLSASGGIVMASANDLIVMFLGLEILSIALYVLAGSHLRRQESQEAALKYFVLGGFSSAVFLYGSALIYGATGSTNFTAIATYLGENVFFQNGLLVTGIVLLLVGLGFKIAAVPFHMWTPDVYQGSPSPVTGFMAAAAKAAGFAGLLRVLFTALDSRRLDWQPVVWVLAIITMIVGAILAATQTDVKRIMAYSSISHAGFILIGLQAANAAGRSGALFYLFAYTFIVLGSFAVISVVGGRGDRAHSLDDYKGLGKRAPVLAVLFTLFLLAQAGIPTTSGFIAKFGVIRAAADAHSYAIAIIAMFVSVIGAFAYLRVVVAMFMSDSDTDSDTASDAGALTVPIGTKVALAVAVAATLFFGIAPQLLVNFADKALLR